MRKKIILLALALIAGIVLFSFSLLIVKEIEKNKQQEKRIAEHKQKTVKPVNQEEPENVQTKKQLKDFQNEPKQAEEVDTSNWKIYRNEKYGYEIKYPEGWQIATDSEYFARSANVTRHSKVISIYKIIDGIIYEMNLYVLDNIERLSLKDWIKQNEKNSRKCQFGPCEIRLHYGDVNGISALIADDIFNLNGTYTKIYINKGEKIYIFMIPTLLPHNNFNPLCCDILNQITNTFIFY